MGGVLKASWSNARITSNSELNSCYDFIDTSVAQDKGHILLVFGKWMSSSQLSSYRHLPVFTTVLCFLALSRMYQSLCAGNWGLVAYTGARPDGAQDQNIELKAAQSCGLKCADSGWNPQEYKGFIRQYGNTASCRRLYCMQKASPHFTLKEQVHCKLFWHVLFFTVSPTYFKDDEVSADIPHAIYCV